MRIALVFPNCNRQGGVERVVLEAANYLSRRGHRTHLLANNWDDALLDPQVACHYIASGGMSSWRLATFARRAVRAARQIDPIPEVFAGFGVQSPARSVTWVQSVHQSWIHISQRHRAFYGRMRQRANPFHATVLALERNYYGKRRYRKLIALTDTVKSDLMRYYNVPEDDIEIIPNGFSPSEFSAARAEARRERMRRKLRLASDQKVIVFVANELERKGFGPLLEAFGRLRDDRAVLMVVGRVNPSGYSGQISRLGDHRVRFMGSSGEVADFYAAADVFALPTQYEAWGLVIVEALASGLPVLTSRLAGASVAVEEGTTGLLLDDPRDPTEIVAKLSRLLNWSPQSRARISESVSGYSWDQILPRYEEVLGHCTDTHTVAGATLQH